MSEQFRKLIQFLSGKTILIAGFGREGQSSFRFLSQHVPDANVIVADYNDAAKDALINIQEFRTGKDYLRYDPKVDLVLRSPGISLAGFSHKWHESEVLSSQTDLLLQFFRKRVIGITGTKGKSTTTTLVHHILTQCGQEAILAGNMGLPFFDFLADLGENELIVAELSSHQLETARHSPRIAVLLNIFPEHLDHYHSFEHYAAAKWNIALWQDEESYLFLPLQLEGEEWALWRNRCKSKTLVFAKDMPQAMGICYTADAIHYHMEGLVGSFPLDRERLPLAGDHNLLNIAAAVGVAIISGIHTPEMLEAVNSFNPLPHRLQKVRTVRGITFINDSISTIPQSAIEAMRAYPLTSTIILGGFDRGIDYKILITYIAQSQLSHVILLGTVGKRIGEMLQGMNASIEIVYANDLKAAVDIALNCTPAGRICLLSPAASSYDQYKNFEHRGNEFMRLVNEITE